MSAPNNSACNFCGVPGHFIRECEIVAEYTRFGKCKRSHDGKVVLPSGAMVPKSIKGTWLRERIDEYHRQNPGQTAAQMLFEVATAPQIDAAIRSFRYPAKPANQYYTYSEETAQAYAFNRPSRPPPPPPEVVITTLPPHRRGRPGPNKKAGGSTSNAVPTRATIEEVPDEAEEAPAVNKGKQVTFAPEPIHPYADAPEAIPRPIPGLVRIEPRPPPAAAKPEPAYTTAAKVYDPRIAKTVYKCAMETPITITQRELLSLSPEVRTQIAEVTTKKRILKEQATMMVEDVLNSDPEEDEDLPKPQQPEVTRVNYVQPQPVTVAAPKTRIVPENATIIEDPYEVYLREHTDGDKPDPVQVAAESSALRAITPTIDNQDKVEAILDPGCQIVAMSEEVCNALALPYDPTIRLNMISANGGVDQSLGLARNVPFLIGDITLYLQVHVLRAPAYDILLGRPFDVLTQSVVRNFANETQTVTILDLNTKHKATVPTIP
jgi:hypothetical protein